MLSGLPLATLVVNLAAAAVALLIGARLARHDVQGPARRASRMFSVWWLALSADILLNMAPQVLSLVGFTPAPLFVAIAYAAVAAICLMFWGLVNYLAYLFTGREGAFWVVSGFYALTFVLAVLFIRSLEPIGATPEGGIAFANEPTPTAALLWALSLLVPPTLGSLAYGSLVFRVKDPFRRYRIAMVSASTFLWFSTAIVVNAPGASDAMRAAGLVIGALSLTGLALAYFPPPTVRRWLDVEHGPMLHAIPSSLPDAAFVTRVDRAARREALAIRARELI